VPRRLLLCLLARLLSFPGLLLLGELLRQAQLDAALTPVLLKLGPQLLTAAARYSTESWFMIGVETVGLEGQLSSTRPAN
jgi:hypothetical protein